MVASCSLLTACGEPTPGPGPDVPPDPPIEKPTVIPAETVILNEEAISLEVGESAQITAVVYPQDTTDELNWYTSHEEIATVENGLVTAINAGTAVITAKAGDVYEVCTVTITQTPVEDNSVTLTIVYNNGTQLEQIKLEKGATPEKPQDPTFGVHTFLGWYSKGVEYDWTAAVTENITVQALWEKSYSNELSLSYGSFYTVENGYRSQGAGILSNVGAGFDRGTIEVSVTAGVKSDNGIILCLSATEGAYFWENEVSYYFFFLNVDGLAYLGRVENGNWLALKTVPVPGYEVGKTYRIKTILDGTNISCYVDGKLYIAFSEHFFLPGTGFGLRAGASNATFENFTVSGKCEY